MEEYQRLNIKQWALEDRPREKLLNKGPSSLSDAELIAILIRMGNYDETAVELSRRILWKVKNNLNELGTLNVDELKKFKGIGEAKAIAIVAAMEIGRRRNQEEALHRETITSSEDAAKYLAPILTDLKHEEFWILHLNRRNKVINSERISQGGMTATVIDVRIILKKALEQNTTSIILCHNHPSGNVQPSKSDHKITTQIKNASEIMDIPVLDHVIVTQTGYFSFADEGHL